MRRIDQWLKTMKKDRPPSSPQKDELNLPPDLDHTLHEFQDCDDLIHISLPLLHLDMIYFEHLVSTQKLLFDVNGSIKEARLEDIPILLRRLQAEPIGDSKLLINGILSGSISIFFQGQAYLIEAADPVAI